MFWSKIKENLASFKVWAFFAVIASVRFMPGMNEAQAGVLTNIAGLAFGANVATAAIKAASEIMSMKKGPAPLDPTPGTRLVDPVS